LIVSLAKPGGNITGSTEISPDVSGKRLEILKEVVSNAIRVAVLWANFSGTADEDEVNQTALAARSLGIKLQSVGVQRPEDFANAFSEMANNESMRL